MSIICVNCGRVGDPPAAPALSCCPERSTVPIASDAGVIAVLNFAAIRTKLDAETLHDAERWRKLVTSARIRLIGWAGFDVEGVPRPDANYLHFGIEVWSHHDTPNNKLGAFLLTNYADAEIRRRGGEPDVDGAWMIVFDDNDEEPEVFMGAGAEGAARARFQQLSANWNVHLFQRVASA